MIKNKIKNKFYYWTFPIIGAICQGIVEIIILIYQDFVYGPDPANWFYTNVIYFRSILFTFIPIYLYLIVLNWNYKYYKLLTTISIFIIFYCIYSDVQSMRSLLPSDSIEKVIEELQSILSGMLDVVFILIPVYWVTYRRYVREKK